MKTPGLSAAPCPTYDRIAAPAVSATAGSDQRAGSRWSWRKYSGNATQSASAVRQSITSQLAPRTPSQTAAARREVRTGGRCDPAA